MSGVALVLGFLAAFALSQMGAVAWEHRRRWVWSRRAARLCTAAGKPLLVVGRPSGLIRTYGEGDVTVDLDPRVKADCRAGCVADVRSIPFADKHFGAAFVSHVLEYLPSVEEMERAVRELHRVADSVFICYTVWPNVWWRFGSVHQKLWLREEDGRLKARRRPW